MRNRARWLVVMGEGVKPYYQKTADIFGSTLKAYWRLNGDALDSSGNGKNGNPGNITYGTGIGDGFTAAFFDGNAGINIIPIAASLNWKEVTVSAWARVSAAADWIDAAGRDILHISVNDGANEIRILKTATDNTLQLVYSAGGVTRNPTAILSTTDWFHVAIVASFSGNYCRFYLNGSQIGADDTTGEWAGEPNAVTTAIGAYVMVDAAPIQGMWKGSIAHVTVGNLPLTSVQIASLYSSGIFFLTDRKLAFSGSSITYAANGYRQKVMDFMPATYPNSNWSFVSTAQNGFTTWTNLINLSSILATNPELIIIDPVNDDNSDFRKATNEALIRRIRTALPNCRLVMMKFFVVTDKDVDASINTPTNQTSFQQWADLGAQYSIQIVDDWQAVKDLITGGAHLSTYLADTVHPTAAGHTVAFGALQPYLASSIHATAMPARLYANSENYETAPTVIVGTDYTSKTGTWAESGTQVSSSEVGATITFTATCRSFGIYRADSTDSGTEYSIDGGAFAGMNSYPAYGWPIASRAEHTITFKVISGTLKIDEFWAV